MPDELIFYGAPQSRAAIVHWMLEELGVPYETRMLDLRVFAKDAEAAAALQR